MENSIKLPQDQNNTKMSLKSKAYIGNLILDHLSEVII